MKKDLLNFEITENNQKSSFSDVLDWERNFSKLRCESHLREPKLSLRTGKEGSAVSIRACCPTFLAQIIEKKAGANGLT